MKQKKEKRKGRGRKKKKLFYETKKFHLVIIVTHFERYKRFFVTIFALLYIFLSPKKINSPDSLSLLIIIVTARITNIYTYVRARLTEETNVSHGHTICDTGGM